MPPTLELEILYPSADPLNRPAVELRRGPHGQLEVDVPPAVLVHRFYYTGDRSFQAQLLPGGPTIIVVAHPQTGERCYVEVQMLPGAPRVTYTDHSIVYDFGQNAITLAFKKFGGQPIVKYRNGLPWHKKIGKAVHAQEIHSGAVDLATRAKETTVGAMLEVGDAVKTVTNPVAQMLEMLPFGKAVATSNLEDQLTERYREHVQQRELERARKESEKRNASVRTIR